MVLLAVRPSIPGTPQDEPDSTSAVREIHWIAVVYARNG